MTVLSLIERLCIALALAIWLTSPASAAPNTTYSINLSKQFATRSLWQLSVTQNPVMDDPWSPGGDLQVPGAISLCLSKTAGASCDPNLLTALDNPATDDTFSAPHYLDILKIVYPKGAARPALLLVRTSSMPSTDGGKLNLSQMLGYDRTEDRFRRIYTYRTGGNNNAEVRFISNGPLMGDVISADPTANAPFGYWITVNALTPSYTYRQALRYRSATHYNDGNFLPVIDSEMHEIQYRLGIRRQGLKLPLPATGCPHPRLIHKELWCYP